MGAFVLTESAARAGWGVRSCYNEGDGFLGRNTCGKWWHYSAFEFSDTTGRRERAQPLSIPDITEFMLRSGGRLDIGRGFGRISVVLVYVEQFMGRR